MHFIKYMFFFFFFNNISTLFHCRWLQQIPFCFYSSCLLSLCLRQKLPFLSDCVFKFYNYFSCIIKFSSRFSSKWGVLSAFTGLVSRPNQDKRCASFHCNIATHPGGGKNNNMIKIIALRNKAMKGTVLG